MRRSKSWSTSPLHSPFSNFFPLAQFLLTVHFFWRSEIFFLDQMPWSRTHSPFRITHAPTHSFNFNKIRTNFWKEIIWKGGEFCPPCFLLREPATKSFILKFAKLKKMRRLQSLRSVRGWTGAVFMFRRLNKIRNVENRTFVTFDNQKRCF